MTDLGLLHNFLGIAVTHDVCDPFLSQRQYILYLLSMAGMNDFHPYHTSMTPAPNSPLRVNLFLMLLFIIVSLVH
jgi:hypothetical protein